MHYEWEFQKLEELWNSLQKQYRDGSINKKDRELYKKWGNALKKLSEDPMLYPSLRSHEIEDLSRRYGMKLQALTKYGRRFFYAVFQEVRTHGRSH